MGSLGSGVPARLYAIVILVAASLVVAFVKWATSSPFNPCDDALKKVRAAMVESAWVSAEMGLPEARLQCADRLPEVRQLEEQIKARVAPR